MAKCDENGASCYWYSGKRKWGECSECGWYCDAKLHPTQNLCAACFEETMDRLHVDDDQWSYPACQSPECRLRTQDQRAARDRSADAEYVAPVVKKKLRPPPPPPLPSRFVDAASSSATAASSLPEPEPSAAAGNPSADVDVLQDTVSQLQDEVRAVSEKMDQMMDLLDALRLMVSLSQPVQAPFQ